MERAERAAKQNCGAIYLGFAFIVLGLLMPVTLQTKWLNVSHKLRQAAVNVDQGVLILTAVQVLLVNALQMLPQVLGAFILTGEMSHLHELCGHRFWLVAPAGILFLMHLLIYRIYGVTYSLFTSIILTALCTGVLTVMKKNDYSLLERSSVITLILFGVQWLDVMPVMDRFGSGNQEALIEIKDVARLMQAEPALDFIGFLFLVFTMILVFLMIRIMVVYRYELARQLLNRERERELQMMRMAAMEAKAFKEVRSLTHDLKTPLTAIQGLISVLQLMVSDQGERAVAICDRISQAADNMNEMITDIVMQDRRQPINLSELLTYTTAQVSPKQGLCSINLSVEDKNLKVAGNRVRLARALANILENALQAMSDTGGNIDISIRSLPDHRVRILIADNGPGISEEEKRQVFELGFSSRGTSGLGLPFASEVIRNHGGTVNLWSVPGVGTKVVIYLPEVIEN